MSSHIIYHKQTNKISNQISGKHLKSLVGGGNPFGFSQIFQRPDEIFQVLSGTRSGSTHTHFDVSAILLIQVTRLQPFYQRHHGYNPLKSPLQSVFLNYNQCLQT